MKKILILFSHPAFHKSRINKKLVEAVSGMEGVTVHKLYEHYPDFFIDVKKEQSLLEKHDILVWHHPFYWYSCPALFKEWIDLVLEHNYAYGENGRALEGKKAISVISTGGRKNVYSESGRNHYTVNQFLAPFHQTATLCRMEYFPPFVVHGSHNILPEEILAYAEKYKKLLAGIRDGTLALKETTGNAYANDLIE